jgi:lipopolysaccharide export system permease protein
MGFKEYKKVFDLKGFGLNKSKDSSFYDPKMLSIRQLNYAIDSLVTGIVLPHQNVQREVTPYIRFANTSRYRLGCVRYLLKSKKVKNFEELVPDSLETNFSQNASISQLTASKGNINVLATITRKTEITPFHEIEWHKKLTLSAACLVFLLIGAPLGSIIRKGGLGLPLVFAIIFFVTFHLFNTFGEKFVKSEQTSAFLVCGCLHSYLIPIGIFLTYKAMRDSQLFNQEFYYRSFKKLRSFLANFRSQKNHP